MLASAMLLGNGERKETNEIKMERIGRDIESSATHGAQTNAVYSNALIGLIVAGPRLWGLSMKNNKFTHANVDNVEFFP